MLPHAIIIMSAESKKVPFNSSELLLSLKEHPQFSSLFKDNKYSFYINELKSQRLLQLIEEFPDLLQISNSQQMNENYYVYSINFISNTIQSHGAFHKIRIYIDCFGQILQILDSLKK